MKRIIKDTRRRGHSGQCVAAERPPAGPADGTDLAGGTGPAGGTAPAGGRASLRTHVAANLVAARRARGWTQAHLARRARIDRAVISRIECARLNITVTTLARLARALDCDPATLVRRRLRRGTVPDPAARTGAPARLARTGRR